MKAIQIGDELIKAQKRRLTREETEALVSIVMIENAKKPLPECFKEPFAMKVLKGRLDYFKVPYETGTLLWLMSLCDTPGDAVLFASAVATVAAKKNDGSAVKLSDMTAPETFGFGIPTKEEMHRVWKMQKVHDGKGPDNWLDREEAWR